MFFTLLTFLQEFKWLYQEQYDRVLSMENNVWVIVTETVYSL